MKAIQRLIEYLDFKGVNKSTYEKLISVSNGYLGTQLKRNADLGEGILNKILDNSLDLNPNWLLTGEGNMLKKEGIADVITPVQIKKGLPLIPLDAMAGFGTGDRQVHSNEVTDYYEVPLFEKRGAKYLIPVAGNSMYPKYASGDLLACKPLTGLNFVQWGKPYVLDTEQGALVKRLFQDPNNEDLLICKSDNTDYYPPFHINKREIYKVAIVVGVIRLE